MRLGKNFNLLSILYTDGQLSAKLLAQSIPHTNAHSSVCHK